MSMRYARLWATGSSRDDLIDGSPARGHIAKHSQHTQIIFRCFKPGCEAEVDDCELFCALHLWSFDNPILRDASIFQT